MSGQTWLSVSQFRRLFGTSSKNSLGQSDSLDSSICSTRLSDSASILPMPTHVSMYHVHFQKLTKAGYNLTKTLHTMILLLGLLNNYFALASTIMQTVEPANFNMSTISKRILMDMDLRTTCKPLHAQISQAESRGQSSSSVNRTNMIKCSPPPQNQWRSQTSSYQPRTFSNQSSGSYSNQPQMGSANPNQKKDNGPAKSE